MAEISAPLLDSHVRCVLCRSRSIGVRYVLQSNGRSVCCIHANYSFPRTLKPVRNGRGVPSEPRTYVVCLDCGKDVPYDWDNMKLIKEENRAA